MKTILLSSALGLSSLALSAIVSVLFLTGAYYLYTVAQPGGDGARRILAWAVTFLCIVLAASILGGASALIASKIGVNKFATLAAAGLFGGAALHFLLAYITFVNGCGLHVSVPYQGTPACQ